MVIWNVRGCAEPPVSISSMWAPRYKFYDNDYFIHFQLHVRIIYSDIPIASYLHRHHLTLHHLDA